MCLHICVPFKSQNQTNKNTCGAFKAPENISLNDTSGFKWIASGCLGLSFPEAQDTCPQNAEDSSHRPSVHREQRPTWVSLGRETLPSQPERKTRRHLWLGVQHSALPQPLWASQPSLSMALPLPSLPVFFLCVLISALPQRPTLSSAWIFSGRATLTCTWSFTFPGSYFKFSIKKKCNWFASFNPT